MNDYAMNYYEKLLNIQNTTYVYEALTYYYETMTMASPTLHFQAVFQKKTNSPTTGYYALFHS